MKLCTKCVMPVTAESLSFDEEGQCSVCHQIEFKQNNINWDQRFIDLNYLVDQYRNKYDYDCLVPFSGGKDSTYTLWYIVEKLKLKPLVIRFDHGFLRPNLQNCAERTFKRLGVDVLHFTSNWQVVRKLMFESLVRRGDFCWHCHTGIFSYPMQIAIKFNIPLIFWGEPDGEYSSFYSYDEIQEADIKRFNKVINLGINAEDMVGMLDDTISSYRVTSRDLKPYTYPSINEIRKAKLKSVFLGTYIPWDVKKQVKIIKKELDWKEDQVEGVPSEYGYEKIECFMQGVRDYIKFLKRGFGRTTHLTSIDIRNDRLTREDALALVDQYDGKRPASLDIFLDILDITEDDFMAAISKHVVAPHQMLTLDELRRSDIQPNDFPEWKQKVKSWTSSQKLTTQNKKNKEEVKVD